MSFVFLAELPFELIAYVPIGYSLLSLLKIALHTVLNLANKRIARPQNFYLLILTQHRRQLLY